MQHWHLSAPELEKQIARARHERALAVQKLVRGAGAALPRAVRALAKVVAALGRRRRRRAALAELRALDDRTLQDIGLARSELPYLADKLTRANMPGHRAAAGMLPGGELLPAKPPRVSAEVDDAAHALRTPLAAIRSCSEILRDHTDLTLSQRDEFLSVMIRESERLEDAIDRVLEQQRAA